MRLLAIQLFGLLGVQALIGRNAPGNIRPSAIDERAAEAFKPENPIVARGKDDEFYLHELRVGDLIMKGTDASVYEARKHVLGSKYALKKDYNDPKALQTEYAVYQAIDGKNIGPALEGRVDDIDTENLDTGLLLQYIEIQETKKGSKEHAKGAVEALKKFHDLGWIHGDTAALGNYLVDKDDDKVYLSDFSKSSKNDDGREKNEDLRNLKSAFSDVKWKGEGEYEIDD
ncbi:hypothetical protein TruAng_003343 [Truncatella angustata]|nr:hypothetical protein TruAng_003343 [Truncatella angustata]